MKMRDSTGIHCCMVTNVVPNRLSCIEPCAGILRQVVLYAKLAEA